MSRRKTSLVRALAITASALTAFCMVVGQEPTYNPSSRSRLVAPVSSSNTIKSRVESRDATVSRDGWVVFEKCLVFPIESVNVPAQESGALSTLGVQENEAVNARQVIAKQETKIAEEEKLISGLNSQIAFDESQDLSEIGLAEAFVEESKLQADLYEKMAAKGNASDTDLRQRQLAEKAARVRLSQSRKAQAQKEVKVKLAQSAHKLSELRLERLTIKTPISGIVKRIDHRAGEWVQAGVTIAEIIRLDEVRVDFFLDSNELSPSNLIEKPIKAVSMIEDKELLFSGRITSSDPEVDSSGRIRMHAKVQNQKAGAQWLLLPGMMVSIQLQKPQ